MGDTGMNPPEIESLNLSDIDVSALDARLELSAIVPDVCITNGSCPSYVFLCATYIP